MGLGMCLSLKQTQALRLSQSVAASLRPYEKILREKIHGVEFKVEREDVVGVPTLKFYRPGESKQWISISMLDKASIDARISELHAGVTPVSLYNKDVRLYINILYYYESLAKAFESNGRIYANPLLENWQISVVEFLGILPDAWIAKIVGKNSASISYYRSRLGIASATENFSDSENIDQEKVLDIQAANVSRLREAPFKGQEKGEESAVELAVKGCILSNSQLSDSTIARRLESRGLKISPSRIMRLRRELAIN